MKKAIIFDLDGTLWNTTKECTLVWSKVAKNYNLKVNRKQIKEIMGLTKEEIIKYFFEDNSELGNKFITECLKLNIFQYNVLNFLKSLVFASVKVI